jgi:hypothetical protein
MSRDEDLARAIRQRDVGAILRMMFVGNPPQIRPGYNTETNLWDYKRDCPRIGREWLNAWAEFSADVLAFHNQNGGVIIFVMGVAKQFTLRLGGSAPRHPR